MKSEIRPVTETELPAIAEFLYEWHNRSGKSENGGAKIDYRAAG